MRPRKGGLERNSRFSMSEALFPNVCLGSLADLVQRPRHVYFTPKGRHSSARVECLQDRTLGCLRKTSPLLQAFRAVLKHLNLLQSDQATRHHLIQHRQELIDLGFCVNNLDHHREVK
jgi:hypothetical protein